ncbi:hypothetical protein J4377_03475 [Halomonas sp. XH26]|uniref:hypothetical protein n=1 Tax=Halomonas sp. XH26 TaxID=2557993 RepID=UPI0020A02CD9|nr:hypothetical protein [Halomonas sp. XH26]UTA80556.1 hypothetical protein J4377_03475 [Halomonas sp. XH26]
MSLIISAFALLISLGSFWVSFDSARLARRTAAAEKRTHVRTILSGVLFEVRELHQVVAIAINYEGEEYRFPDGLDKIEQELARYAAVIPGRLKWLSDDSPDDPVKLEEYRSHALELESRMTKVRPMIQELKVEVIPGKSSNKSLNSSPQNGAN